MPFATYPSLSGKSVFVTGGASGIGADIVKAFHGQGANVGFVDILEKLPMSSTPTVAEP